MPMKDERGLLEGLPGAARFPVALTGIALALSGRCAVLQDEYQVSSRARFNARAGRVFAL